MRGNPRGNEKPSENLRVLHVAETCKGGVGSAIRDIVNGASGRGMVHQVLRPIEHDIPGIGAHVGVSTFARRDRGVRSLFSLAKALRLVVEERRPDVVHAHSTFAGFVARVTLAKMWLKGNLAIAYTAHGWSFDRPGRSLTNAIYALIESVLSRLCDRIICLSRHEQKLALMARISQRKLQVIYNAHPLTDQSKSLETTGDGPEYRALFVGRFDRQKGFDILLEAIHLLSDTGIKFTIIGEAVRDGAPNLDLPARVEILGWQSPEVVYSYMRRATVLIVPSRWEGFALAPLEAMCLGTPVLSSDASSLPEAVIEGVSGKCFKSGSAGELAAVLRGTTIDEWAAMGIQAEQFCKAAFSPDAMLDATYKLYREIST